MKSGLDSGARESQWITTLDGISTTSLALSSTSSSGVKLLKMIAKLLQCMLLSAMERDSTLPMEHESGSPDTQMEASGVWIKDFQCHSCGSTLGRWSKGVGRREDKMCFTCGAGEFELNDYELAGLDLEEALRLAGREWGTAGDIYVRVNAPSERWSHTSTSKRAISALERAFGVAIEVLKQDITLKDIQDVTNAMKQLLEEERCITK